MRVHSTCCLQEVHEGGWPPDQTYHVSALAAVQRVMRHIGADCCTHIVLAWAELVSAALHLGVLGLFEGKRV